MSDDIQKLLQEALANRLDKDDFIQKFRETLKQHGAAGLKLEDAHEYAQRRGEASSGALLDVIKPGVLPNDRMDFTTANQTVRPLLEENFDDVQDAANQVQKALDREEGIGLNGVKADFPKDRADGLIDKLTDSETIEELRKWLAEPIILFSAAAFDQWVQTNADFRHKAGMSPKIIRKGHIGMCPWCAALVGTYNYEAVRYSSDVFRRHKHCKCTVTYVNGGTRQDVWSKKTWQASREELEKRKTLHREIFKGPVENALANPLASGIIKATEAISADTPSAERTYDTSQYPHNPDGTVVVSRVVNNKVPNDVRPYEVIDVRTTKGTINRTYIDAEGRRGQRIDSTDHGQPKNHPEGAHKHIIIYDEKGNYLGDGPWIPLNDKDKLENADLSLQIRAQEDTDL